MAGPLLVKTITPKLLNTPRMRGLMLSALTQTEKEVMADYESTVMFWNHKVQFLHRVFSKGGNLQITVYAIDYVWQLLEGGTARRFAIMTRGFVPKTRPGRIRSNPGLGGVAKIGANPRPGIQPRDWNRLIRMKNEKTFKERIAAAIFKGLK